MLKQASRFMKIESSLDDHEDTGTGMFGRGKRRKELGAMGIAELKELVLKSSSSSSNGSFSSSAGPDYEAMMLLASLCARAAFEHPKGKRMELLMSTALLMEYCLKNGGSSHCVLSDKEEAVLARVHCEIWLGKGVNAEIHNLRRALQLFEKCTESKAETFKEDAVFWNEYVRVLQLSGNNETAALTMKEILKSFSGSESYPMYLFATGAIYKALGQHDVASDYLFEATQIGPPKLFSKLDMMFIISRNIEESNRNKDDDGADAYEMVHEHLVIDGLLDASISYHDWISNSDTWRSLADKCQIVGLYPLATDLYGQALLRDQQAYLKSKLWFGYAKACARSGRSSEAQLAIKQALTIDPYNRQLIYTQKAWSEDRPAFEATTNDLRAILEGVPVSTDKRSVGITQLQAVAHGQSTRTQLFVGQGSRDEVRSRMSAQVGVLVAKTHPLLIKASADWIGRVKHLVVFDLKNNTKSKLKLSAPIAPAKQVGVPRRLLLSLHAQTRRVARGMMYNRLNGSNRNALEEIDQTLISIRFTDETTSEYMEKRFILKHPELDFESMGDIAAASYLSDDSLGSGTLHFKEAIPGTCAIRPLEAPQSFVDAMGIEDDASASVYTDIIDSDLARAGFTRDGHAFLLWIRNEGVTSRVTVLRLSQMKSIEMVLSREYFDRSIGMKKYFKFVIEIMSKVPFLAEMMLDVKQTSTSQPLGARMGIRINGKFVLVAAKKSPTGATMELLSPSADAVIGASTEVLSKTNEEVEVERQRRIAKIDIPTRRSPSPKLRTGKHKEAAEKPSDFNNFLKFVSQSSKSSPASNKGVVDEDSTLIEKAPLHHKSHTAFSLDDTLALGSSLDDDSVTGAEIAPPVVQPSSPLSGARSPGMTLRKALSAPGVDVKEGAPDGGLTSVSQRRSVSTTRAPFSMLGEGEDTSTGEGEGHDGEDEDAFGLADGESDDPEAKRNRKASGKKSRLIDADSLGELLPDIGASRKMSVIIKEQFDPAREAKKKAVKEQRLREKHLREEKAKEKEKERKKKEEAADKGDKYKRTTVVDFTKMKKFAKKAPKNAVNFLEHQHTRMVATDYLRDRAVKAVLAVRREEAAAYLLERAAAAVSKYNADLAKYEAKIASASAASLVKDSSAGRKSMISGVGKVERKVPVSQKSTKGGVGTKGAAARIAKDDATKASFTSGSDQTSTGRGGDGTAAEGEDKTITEQSVADSQAATIDDAAAASSSRPPSRAGDIPPPQEISLASAKAQAPTIGKSLSEMLNEMLLESDEPKSTTASIIILENNTATASTAAGSTDEPATGIEETSSIMADLLTLIPPAPEIPLSRSSLSVDTCADLISMDDGITAALGNKIAELSPSMELSPKSGKPRRKKAFSPYKNLSEEMSAKSSPKHGRRPLNLSDIPHEAYRTPEALVQALRALGQSSVDAADIIPPAAERGIHRGRFFSDENLAFDGGLVGPADSSVTSRYSMDIDRGSLTSNRSHVKKKDAKALLRKMIGEAQSAGYEGSSLASPVSTRPSTRARNELLDLQQQRLLQPRVLPLNNDQTSSLFAPLSLTENSVTKVLRPLRLNSSAHDPIGFMVPGASAVQKKQPPLYMKSIEQFQKKGYNDGNDMYASAWRATIQGCLAQSASMSALRKAISNLQKIAHMPLSRTEALCVIADSNGSVNESLGKILNAEYFREIKLVCALLPIENVIEAVVDGRAGHRGAPLAFLGGGIESLYTIAGSGGKRAGEATALARRAEIESLHDEASIASSLTGNSRMSPETLIRMHGIEASTRLAHMNMKGHAPAVVKRGHVVLSPGRGQNSNLSPVYSESRAMDFNFEDMGIDPNMDPRATFKSQETSLTNRTGLSNSSKILRVDKTMDDHIQGESAPMVIMSRKQALMAREDELLSRSDKPQFQKLSSQFKVDKKRLRVDTI